MEQWYSDAYFPRRQMYAFRNHVCFMLKGRSVNNRNYSLSNSHARIAFGNVLTILTAITIQALIISCRDVNNAREQNSVFRNCVSRMDITLYGLCVCIAKEAFSNRKKRCLIDRFMNRIRILRGVYVFNSM